MFIYHPSIFSWPFMDFTCELTTDEIFMTSDAAGKKSLGMASICGTHWSFQQWNSRFITENNPSIEYLELLAVLNGVLLWIHEFKNQRIILFCDNESVVEMINASSSSCRNCMVLIRMLVLKGLTENVRIFARHISGKSNYFSDALSCLDVVKFKHLAGEDGREFDDDPTPIHEDIWPLEKIWHF